VSLVGVRVHLDPEPRVVFGRALGLSGLATAMLDLSDGVSRDLPRLCAASAACSLSLRKFLKQVTRNARKRESRCSTRRKGFFSWTNTKKSCGK